MKKKTKTEWHATNCVVSNVMHNCHQRVALMYLQAVRQPPLEALPTPPAPYFILKLFRGQLCMFHSSKLSLFILFKSQHIHSHLTVGGMGNNLGITGE